MTLPRRLGLETANIPHADRHGLAWLSRCRFVGSRQLTPLPDGWGQRP